MGYQSVGGRVRNPYARRPAGIRAGRLRMKGARFSCVPRDHGTYVTLPSAVQPTQCFRNNKHRGFDLAYHKKGFYGFLNGLLAFLSRLCHRHEQQPAPRKIIKEGSVRRKTNTMPTPDDQKQTASMRLPGTQTRPNHGWACRQQRVIPRGRRASA